MWPSGAAAQATSKLKSKSSPWWVPRRARSMLLGWRSLVWMLTSLLTSESN